MQTNHVKMISWTIVKSTYNYLTLKYNAYSVGQGKVSKIPYLLTLEKFG